MKKLTIFIAVLIFPFLFIADDRYPAAGSGIVDGSEGCFTGVLASRDEIGSITVTGSNGGSYYLLARNRSGYTVATSSIEEIRKAELGVAVGFFCWKVVNNKTYLRSVTLKQKKEAVASTGSKPSVYDNNMRDKDNQARALHTRALGAKNKGNYDEAFKICQAILVFHSSYEPAQSLLKEVTKAMKQKEAEAHLTKAVDLAVKGKILEASSEWQLALTVNPDDEELQKTIKQIKEDIVVSHNRKAKELLESDKLIEAAAEWNLILAIEKEDPVAKKGLETVNKKLDNFSLLERVKMQYETALASAKKEYEAKNYLAAILNYQSAVKFTEKLQKDKDTAFIKSEIKKIEGLVESSRKSYLDNAARFADAKDWLNTGKELRNCLRIDPANEKAASLLSKYKVEIDELKEKLYLEGLEAYGSEDIEVAISKWSEVLILDPDYEKAALNIKKADRKRVKK